MKRLVILLASIATLVTVVSVGFACRGWIYEPKMRD